MAFKIERNIHYFQMAHFAYAVAREKETEYVGGQKWIGRTKGRNKGRALKQ